MPPLDAKPGRRGQALTHGESQAFMPTLSTPDRERNEAMPVQSAPSELMHGLMALALEAGRAVMAIYGTEHGTRLKDDRTPVTEADVAAEAIILEGLTSLSPGIPVISEEQASEKGAASVGETFFLVDPLDGTREFISRNGEFTINIALVEDAAPAAGIVYAPAVGRLFWAEKGAGAFEALVSGDGGTILDATRRPLRASPLPASRLRVVASRSHRDAETDRWLEGRDVASLVSAGSSLKFCLVAAAEADVYPRFGRTMEWDTAAGHAILAAAGGRVVDGGGNPLRYGKAGFANGAFVASGA